MNIRCSCGAGYQVTANLAGKQVRCKKCNEVFVVPANSPSTAEVPEGITRPNRKKQKTPAELKREKEDALLAKFSKSKKKSSEDFIADNIRDGFEEQQHSAAVRNVFIGPVCIVLAVMSYFLLASLENGGVAPRIVWVFVLLKGKYWVPPLIFIFGAWSLFSGVVELISIGQARRQRSES